jgi:quercetin dioxygenase-like cupin family protein
MEEVGLQGSAFTFGAFAPVVEMHELAGEALPAALVVRELLWGNSAVLVEMSAPAGFVAPSHAHEHESLVYVLSGRMRATVEGETHELGPGDCVVHAVEARHLIEAIVETRWIEVKAPPSATWPAVGPDQLRR